MRGGDQHTGHECLRDHQFLFILQYLEEAGLILMVPRGKTGFGALRKANDLLRLAVVLRDAHDAITVQDLDGRIVETWLTATALDNDTGKMYAIATTEREAVKS